MAPDEFDRLAATGPIMAEVREMLYLFHQPLILDSSQSENAFDLKPTALEDVLGELVIGAN